MASRIRDFTVAVRSTNLNSVEMPPDARHSCILTTTDNKHAALEVGFRRHWPGFNHRMYRFQELHRPGRRNCVHLKSLRSECKFAIQMATTPIEMTESYFEKDDMPKPPKTKMRPSLRKPVAIQCR